MVGAGDSGAGCAGRDDACVARGHSIRTEFAQTLDTSRGTQSLYTANMSSRVSVDEFLALEQKVLRAVEIVKREREALAAAGAEIAALREQLAAREEATDKRVVDAEARAQAAESQVAALNEERDAVRQRVDKMLQQMDELG